METCLKEAFCYIVILPLEMTTDSLSQSMLAAGLAWTLHLILWSVFTLANCSWGASSHVMPTATVISEHGQG